LEGDTFDCKDLSEEQHESYKRQKWLFGSYEYEGCPGCLLRDSEIITQLNFYSDYLLMGLPFADLGWAEHPAWMISVIKTLENEKAIIRKEKE